ncbi:ABC transporter ATP-binding protein [Ureaplasma zalophigenitalium]|uniref:ABC transporter ATP-binding protein n=1 Tax=Ureaplasma zalophigenitalium TaxID=907723 RepID=A0ABT3BPN0_9BACT|nr:ABC transporter ATP-binding protein [Ureaplasma zalophigenitalium]MCV3754200.1 ABC transporter ATP-binding protein [Ureaplasma zalophigenitalium]
MSKKATKLNLKNDQYDPETNTIDLEEVRTFQEKMKKESVNRNEVLFDLRNVSLGYGSKMIVKNLTAQIMKNDFVVVLGPNGSGKSTLIKGLCRILVPRTGQILFNNKLIRREFLVFQWFKLQCERLINVFKKDRKDVIESLVWNIKNKEFKAYNSKKLALELAYVPQLSVFPENTTIYDFVKMGRYPWSNAVGVNANPKREQKIIETALKNVGIFEFRHKELDDLSGGQRQKALIALSLAQDTDTIVLDEPTNHLDIRSQLEIIELLHKLHHKLNKTIVLVIHDINTGIKYADKVMIIKDGKMIRYTDVLNCIDEQLLHDVFGVDTIIIRNKDQEHSKVLITNFALPPNYDKDRHLKTAHDDE